MGFFTKRSEKTDVELLEQKSNNIVSVFTRTIAELKSVNEEISESAEQKETLKRQLEQELAKLDYIKVSNEKVISKIERILE